MAEHERITQDLLAWYARKRRDLPWRRTRDPYRIWVSEIMLQQTQVDTVIPYYQRFLSQFPTLRDLAGASSQAVLKAWENLGYYARARHLHEAARIVESRMKGKMPRTLDGLMALPGIGPYTAAAILSIAFGQPVAAVDGNVRRVVCRLFALQQPIHQSSTQKRIHALAEELVPKTRAGRFNQGLMDLGARICTPKNPACAVCPLHASCKARKMNLQERIPVTRKRAPLPHRHLMAALIRDQRNRILMVRRPDRGLLGGLWKFPGREKHPEETMGAALKRTVREETGLDIKTGKAITAIEHAYTHFRITLHAFHGRPVQGTRWNPGFPDHRWVTLEEIHRLPLSKADRKILAVL